MVEGEVNLVKLEVKVSIRPLLLSNGQSASHLILEAMVEEHVAGNPELE